MYKRKLYFKMAMGSMLFAACSSQQDAVPVVNDMDNIIHVSGLTRADEASNSTTIPDWLSDGLYKKGMVITYYQSISDKKKAVLKSDKDGSFSLTTDEENIIAAKWLGNGAHTFEGVYIPSGLKEGGQRTYDDLCQYTAIPPSKKINATLASITIPLQHRLARVEAYVLIEKTLGENITLKGYDKNATDAKDTKLRFCNVKTLKHVSSDGHPVWQEERKAIPHYLGEKEVTLYTNKNTGEIFFPSSETEWDAADADFKANGESSSFTSTNYGLCPYYDLVVRPTYKVPTSGSNVMYDENNPTADLENQIVFELTLSNDLEYEKRFVFDLNANDETVVYLRVTPERIDYSSAGSRLWKSKPYSQDYYGVNHDDHTLSAAGSSWQRAFTNTSLEGDAVSDGKNYNVDENNVGAQYVSNEQFVELLKTATTGGSCDGRYFILAKEITIDVSSFDDNFVFTGHLDGLDNIINLTDSKNIGRDTLFPNLGAGAEVLNVKYKKQ